MSGTESSREYIATNLQTIIILQPFQQAQALMSQPVAVMAALIGVLAALLSLETYHIPGFSPK
jgi:hypothetical protein